MVEEYKTSIMALGIKKHNLDFEILDTDNPRTLVFMDSSEYSEQPERPLLEITLPGHNKYFLVNINAGKLNTFNSNTIGMTESIKSHEIVTLPDGVYTLKYKVCPYEYVFITKRVLRTVLLDAKLDKVLKDFRDGDCLLSKDAIFKREIVDIMLLIAAAKANAKSGDYKRASDEYHMADKLVTRLLDKLNLDC